MGLFKEIMHTQVNDNALKMYVLTPFIFVPNQSNNLTLNTSFIAL